MQADALARQVRGLANGVAVTANWSANALVAQTFLSLARALGPAGVFWLYAAVAAAGAAWVYLALPETAGAPAPAPRSGLRRWRLCRGQALAACAAIWWKQPQAWGLALLGHGNQCQLCIPVCGDF